jgi:hypothetical protein
MHKSIWLSSLVFMAAARCAVADEAPTPAPTPTVSPQAVADARAACETDVQKLCPDVQPGGGRILACLKQHQADVTEGCKQAVTKALKPAT